MPSFSQRHIVLASYIIIAGGLLLVFPLRLLPSLLAGLLVFELVNMLTPQLQRLIAGRRARWLAVALLGTVIVSVLALIFAGAISFLLHEAENPGASLNKFMAVVDRARGEDHPRQHDEGEQGHQAGGDPLAQPVAQAVVRADDDALGTVVDGHGYRSVKCDQYRPYSLAPSTSVSRMDRPSVTSAEVLPNSLLTAWQASMYRWRRPAMKWCR